MSLSTIWQHQAERRKKKTVWSNRVSWMWAVSFSVDSISMMYGSSFYHWGYPVFYIEYIHLHYVNMKVVRKYLRWFLCRGRIKGSILHVSNPSSFIFTSCILFGSIWPCSNYCRQHYKLLLGFIGALQCVIEKSRPMKQSNNVSCGTGVTFIYECRLLLQESRIWKHMKGLEFNCVAKICHNWLLLLCFLKSGAMFCLILSNALPFEQH